MFISDKNGGNRLYFSLFFRILGRFFIEKRLILWYNIFTRDSLRQREHGISAVLAQIEVLALGRRNAPFIYIYYQWRTLI